MHTCEVHKHRDTQASGTQAHIHGILTWRCTHGTHSCMQIHMAEMYLDILRDYVLTAFP